MSAGGFDNNLRRGLAIVMALLTLAVAALWVDSYRWHAPDRTVVATKGIPAFGEPRNLPPAEAHDDIGLSRSLNVGDGRQITFFSIQGGLGFQYADLVADGARVTNGSKSRGGFSYGQSIDRDILSWDKDRLSLIPGHVRYRWVAMPHWAALVLSSAYSAFFMLRGPLRRRRRRTRGQCLECGYDLSHSPGRCPECGVIVHTRNHVGVARTSI